MTQVTTDPGSARGRPVSAAVGLFPNPVGLLTGSAAARALGQGTAVALAGGPVAFTQVELIRMGESGAIETEIVPVTTGETDLSSLAEPRPPFAGFDLARPVLMGIVNVTPDSFSDGGDFLDPARAIEQALRLADEGADIVDVGGESTRPGATTLSVSEEIDRVLPVIDASVAAGICVSVDTRRSEVMRAAIGAGARIVNDVTALTGDSEALNVVASSDVSVILMHMLGAPDTMQTAPTYRLASAEILVWLQERIAACTTAGISRDRIAVDPGIGFGKTDAHNLEILGRAGLFHATGCAVAIGVSRKSFIGRIAGIDAAKDRLPGTIAATGFAVSRGVQIHRVHDVAEVRQALAVCNALNENA